MGLMRVVLMHMVSMNIPSLCLEFLKGKNIELHSSSLHQDVDFYNDGAPILKHKDRVCW